MNNSNNPYHEILHLIEKGFYEEASERIRSMRKSIELPFQDNSQSHLNILSILLSCRIAMKGGQVPHHILQIQTASISDPLILGEVNFVKGLYYSNLFKFSESTECFKKSSLQLKQSGSLERSWLAQFNYIIGKTHDDSTSIPWIFSELRNLEKEVSEGKNNKLLGIIYRQKSILYKESKRYNAAKLDALKAIPLIELYGSLSDYHLALLNLVDIHLELNERNLAIEVLERVLPPIDPRVHFPLSYFQHRLTSKPLDESAKRYSCPHFLQRYQEWKLTNPYLFKTGDVTPIEKIKNIENVERLDLSLTDTALKHSHLLSLKWNSLRGELTNQTKVFLFKEKSLEKALIDHIFKSPVTKGLLCERLWPSSSELRLLDNRLHRLVSRVNKKIGDLIQFQNGKYFFKS